jgi:hypothetical protein
MKLALPLVAMVVGGILVWLAAAWFKVRLSAKTHSKWEAVASKYGLEVGRSGGLDAPTLHGEVDGREVKVRPIYEERAGRSSRRVYTRTEFTCELPVQVPAELGLVDTGSTVPVGQPGQVEPVSLGLEDLYDMRGGREVVEQLFDEPSVVDRFFELHEYASDIQLEDRTLGVSVHEEIHNADEIVDVLEQLRATAEAVAEAFGADRGGERHW